MGRFWGNGLEARERSVRFHEGLLVGRHMFIFSVPARRLALFLLALSKNTHAWIESSVSFPPGGLGLGVFGFRTFFRFCTRVYYLDMNFFFLFFFFFFFCSSSISRKGIGRFKCMAAPSGRALGSGANRLAVLYDGPRTNPSMYASENDILITIAFLLQLVSPSLS